MKNFYVKRTNSNLRDPDSETFDIHDCRNHFVVSINRIEMIDNLPEYFYEQYGKKEAKYLLDSRMRPEIIAIAMKNNEYEDILMLLKIQKEKKPSWVDEVLDKVNIQYFKERYDVNSKFWNVE